MKALLTNINSLWGVIINPQSSNTYREILSFETPDLKDEFINNKLFNGENYKDKILLQPEIAITYDTATKATFRVNPLNYPNETFNSLLNKDFAIIKDNNEYLFYTLQGKRIGSIIEYTADIDIFFTYDIKDMFNNNKVNIKRAHSNRYKLENNAIKSVLNTNNAIKLNDSLNDPLYMIEDFEIQEIFPSTERTHIRENYDNFINQQNFTPLQKTQLKKYLKELYFSVVYKRAEGNYFTGTKNEEVSFELFNPREDYNTGTKAKDTRMNYIAKLGITGYSRTLFEVEITDMNWVKIAQNSSNFLNISITTLQDPKVISQSHTILPHIPLMANYWRVDRFDATKSKYILQIKYNGGEVNKNFTHYLLQEIKAAGGNIVDYSLIIKDSANTNPIDNNIFIKKYDEIIETNIPSINNNRDVKYEPKLYLAPFRKVVISCGSNNKFEVLPQFLKDTNTTFEQQFLYSPEDWRYLIKVKNYMNLNNVNVIENMLNVFEERQTYQLPSSIDAYENFLLNNQSQLKAQQASNVTKTALGIGGAAIAGIFGLLTGGVGLAAGGAIALGAAGAAASSVTSINEMNARKSDIRNVPDKIVNLQSSLIADIQYKSIKPYMQEFKIDKTNEQMIYDYLYKYGYKMNNQLKNINDYLASRYYFNYIECTGTFEINKLQVSAEIKQIIDTSLEKGLTIWHYRDAATFNGIKYYEKENMEMDVLEWQKP